MKVQPKGSYADLARSRLEEIEYKLARGSSDETVMKAFLASYPQSKHRETIAFRLATVQGTDESYIAFIKAYPDSKLAKKAAHSLKKYRFYSGVHLIPWSALPTVYAGKTKGYPVGVNLEAFKLSPGETRLPRLNDSRALSSLIVGPMRFYKPGDAKLIFRGWTDFDGHSAIGTATLTLDGLRFDGSSKIIQKQ